MEKSDILKLVDHTYLKPTATWKDIEKILDDAIFNETASVCIPPYYVSRAKQYLQGKVKICTVIGFPNGYSTTKTKIYETKDAIKNGADEIDMVINIGMLKQRQYEEIVDEISKIKKVCKNKILKVIVETCLLTEEEKRKMCHIVAKANADYIKTSTGFSTGGATIEDIEIFKEELKDYDFVKIKAAGGIKNFQEAEQFIKKGASRLGTSRLIK